MKLFFSNGVLKKYLNWQSNLGTLIYKFNSLSTKLFRPMNLGKLNLMKFCECLDQNNNAVDHFITLMKSNSIFSLAEKLLKMIFLFIIFNIEKNIRVMVKLGRTPCMA